MLSSCAGEGHKEAKKRVKREELSRVAKVVGLSKLKTKYESHESKRQLCAAYDLFVADERIIPSLPKLLGESTPPIPFSLPISNNTSMSTTFYRTSSSMHW